MFYVIYFAVIALALYLIFHDRFGEEGHRKNMSSGPSSLVGDVMETEVTGMRH